MKNKKTPKILLWDIETSMSIAKTFNFWNTNIHHGAIVKEWYIISGAWKFLGEKEVHAIACSKSGLKKGDDKRVVKALCKAISEADLIIGHNGDKFDLKKLKARVIKHGLPPVNHTKTLDTLKCARREFNFSYNNLDYLGAYLEVGQKIKNEPGLWDKVMAGDMDALGRMVKYNKQDVKLLEAVYLKMRPHITNHPNVNVMVGDSHLVYNCPNCGSEKTIKNGKRPAMKISKIFQKRACHNCGHSFLEKKPLN